MEELVKLMQHPQSGIAVKNNQQFMLRMPNSFSGVDLVSWLTKTLGINETGIYDV